MLRGDKDKRRKRNSVGQRAEEGLLERLAKHISLRGHWNSNQKPMKHLSKCHPPSQ
jgi:hypothetical protein